MKCAVVVVAVVVADLLIQAVDRHLGPETLDPVQP